jgi:hypothetical protein
MINDANLMDNHVDKVDIDHILNRHYQHFYQGIINQI